MKKNNKENNFYLKLTMVLLMPVFFLFNCKKEIHIVEEEIKTDSLIIYSSYSFAMSDLRHIVIEEFERRYECTVIIYSFNDSYLLLNHLRNDRDSLQADLVIGVNSPHLYSALQTNLFLQNEPDIVRNIANRDLVLDRRHRLIPYNYDYYAFVYDSDIVETPPKTFGEMQSSVWNDRIIMIDPRTSSIGMGALMWSLGIFGDRGFEQFWISLRNNISSVAPSFTDAYAAFQAGEAPIILSYITNPAYHIEVENTNKFRAFIPDEGRVKEIEFAGILQGAENLYLARRFLEFMLSHDFQSYIPTSQWKFPVLEGIEMPVSLANLRLPVNVLSEHIFERTHYFDNEWAELWTTIISEK